VLAMSDPPLPQITSNGVASQSNTLNRSNSMSQASDASQTAQEYVRWIYYGNQTLIRSCSFINSQLQLEADAREALPYVRIRHA